MAGRIIIVGGGGFTRELYFWARDCADAGRLPPLHGYLDDAGDVLRNRGAYQMAYCGTVEAYTPSADDQFLLGIGSPAVKRRVHGKLAERGARFATLLHPKTTIAATCTMEEGLILCPGGMLGPDNKIGRFVTVNCGSGTGHDSTLGDFSVLASNIVVSGEVDVGADVSIGSGAVVLPRLRIGQGATVGPGAVVYRSVRQGATVFAPPAKQLRPRKEGA